MPKGPTTKGGKPKALQLKNKPTGNKTAGPERKPQNKVVDASRPIRKG